MEDSSTIKLPDQLKEVWAGCRGWGGGQGQSQAGLKLHVRLRSEAGWRGPGPRLPASRQADQRSALRQEGIAAGVLNITE